MTAQPIPAALDARLTALARATVAHAHLPADLAKMEEADLVTLLRTHAADAIAGEQTPHEILEGAETWRRLFLMGRG